MGCILCCSKQPENEGPANSQKPVEYSWDQRKNKDPKKFTIENCSDSCTGRLPGSINGEQFIIQNCKKMRIYLLDNIGTISIDDCSDCDFIIGPVKTSIFIRDCVRCNIMVACQQFRTRDCRNLNVFLSCTSQPIIESTSKMKVGCYQLYYPKLAEQFKAANLSPFNCTWSDIYDFTPVADQGSNSAFLPETTKPFDIISPPASVLNSDLTGNHGDSESADNAFVDNLIKMEITDSRKSSVVPYTFGLRRTVWSDAAPQIVSLIILFFNNFKEQKLAHDFIQYTMENFPHTFLMKTRETKLSPETAKNLFGAKVTENDAALRGPIISLEYNGSTPSNELVSAFKQNFLPKENLANLMYVSPDVETSRSQIEIMNNLINMGMNTS